MINWISLTDQNQLALLHSESFTQPQLIFKHSIRCSLSSIVLDRFERSAFNPRLNYYYLDLIRFRDLSDRIAEKYNVFHESPQVLLIQNGECVFEESHYAIRPEEITAQL